MDADETSVDQRAAADWPPAEVEPRAACSACRDGHALDFDFTMAFQPIVDVVAQTIVAYEALVRGPQGQGAGWVLDKVTSSNLYAFDQACRVRAIEWAAKLAMPCRLSINFLPNAVYRPQACIRATLLAARRVGFPMHQIMFEITESERVSDGEHLTSIVAEYRRRGFAVAIDDFGAGYAGLNLLARFQPDIIKIDMELVRGIDRDPVRQTIVEGLMLVARRLGIEVIAEGVESEREAQALFRLGVRQFQGFLFARPAVEALVPVGDIVFPRLQ